MRRLTHFQDHERIACSYSPESSAVRRPQVIRFNDYDLKLIRCDRLNTLIKVQEFLLCHALSLIHAKCTRHIRGVASLCTSTPMISITTSYLRIKRSTIITLFDIIWWSNLARAKQCISDRNALLFRPRSSRCLTAVSL